MARGGGLSPDGLRWIACRPGFFLPVRVLSKLFRRLMLERLVAAHAAGKLAFLGAHAPLADAGAFASFLAPLKKTKWFVYSKRPFAGPGAVLAYLARYTHRVAIANSRLIAVDDGGVRFRWKDYRADGRARYKTMTLAPHEFIRRFLIHVLPAGFHRIRHYGLFANGQRRDTIARARALLDAASPQASGPERTAVRGDPRRGQRAGDSLGASSRITPTPAEPPPRPNPHRARPTPNRSCGVPQVPSLEACGRRPP